MKGQETQREFIKLRAEGYSYQKIADKLSISKGTCHKWEQRFNEEISSLKEEKLSELYQEYGMAKEGRINALGKTLNKINAAIDEIDLASIDPAKLLELKLKYQDALKKEYHPAANEVDTELNSAAILQELGSLIGRIKRGEVDNKEAGVEMKALATALSAYDKTVLEDKMDKLTDALEG
ncbi:MAG: helix-turn-helix domain-containing protein [Anaeroplasma bactoclasticum]|nr:helix-turn-helix domain-containing protein [Anaeroplasma bactoclasticum]MCM1514477.1 helix-turn-helix domain-containing protein [Anaeroplasma bactoclasticum]